MLETASPPERKCSVMARRADCSCSHHACLLLRLRSFGLLRQFAVLELRTRARVCAGPAGGVRTGRAARWRLRDNAGAVSKMRELRGARRVQLADPGERHAGAMPGVRAEPRDSKP